MMKVKVVYGDDMRRWRYPESNKYIHLIEFICDTFKFIDCTKFYIQYEDDENDLVTISSEDDFDDAFTCAQDEQRKSLKIFVKQGSITNAHSNVNVGDDQVKAKVSNESVQTGPVPSNEQQESTKKDCSYWRQSGLNFLENGEIQTLLPQLVRRVVVALRAESKKVNGGVNEEKRDDNDNDNEEPKDFATILREILSEEQFAPIANHELVKTKLECVLKCVSPKVPMYLPILLTFNEDAIAAWVPHLIQIGIRALKNFENITFDIDIDPNNWQGQIPEWLAFTDTPQQQTNNQSNGFGWGAGPFGPFGFPFGGPHGGWSNTPQHPPHPHPHHGPRGAPLGGGHFGPHGHHHGHHGHHGPRGGRHHFGRHGRRHGPHGGPPRCPYMARMQGGARQNENENPVNENINLLNQCTQSFGNSLYSNNNNVNNNNNNDKGGCGVGKKFNKCAKKEMKRVKKEVKQARKELRKALKKEWKCEKQQQKQLNKEKFENKKNFKKGGYCNRRNKRDSGITCVCGEILDKMVAFKAYKPHTHVTCDVCNSRVDSHSLVYHCPSQRSIMHPNGYDVCGKCVALQMSSFEAFGKDQQYEDEEEQDVNVNVKVEEKELVNDFSDDEDEDDKPRQDNDAEVEISVSPKIAPVVVEPVHPVVPVIEDISNVKGEKDDDNMDIEMNVYDLYDNVTPPPPDNKVAVENEKVVNGNKYNNDDASSVLDEIFGGNNDDNDNEEIVIMDEDDNDNDDNVEEQNNEEHNSGLSSPVVVNEVNDVEDVEDVVPVVEPVVEPVVPLVVPEAEPEPEEELFVYQDSLDSIVAMGFEDNDGVRALLIQHKGNLDRAINQLLG